MYAVIFDVDGVLVDSEALSCGAWLPVLRRRSIAVRLADIEGFIGQSDGAVLDHFRERHPAVDLGDRPDRREGAGVLRCRPRPPAELSRAEAGAATAPGRGRCPWPSPPPAAIGKIRFSLRTAGLEGFFDVVCSASDVARGKPAPDLFLRAAGLLGAEPGNCSVVEDSVPGIAAAKAAGMKALGFTSSHPAAGAP